ncbi:MAG TPA: hypothetical protein VLE43_01360, partial [Candidatus Saccharimonadia bacterium]|nr:hypothetical protein [Candidatus Saccharimonadia bacterium]
EFEGHTRSIDTCLRYSEDKQFLGTGGTPADPVALAIYDEVENAVDLWIVVAAAAVERIKFRNELN